MNKKLYDLDIFFQTTKKDLEYKITTTVTDKKIVSILSDEKHLPSLLAHLSFKACTGGKETPSQYQRVLEIGVAIELAHTASLVHDDIIDRDKERRGKTAFYVKKSVDYAILNGHKMLALGFNIAVNHGEEISRLYIDTWSDILTGGIEEISFNKKDIKNKSDEISAKSQTFKDYNKIINLKTASLFSSACKAGALEANKSGEILRIFADYGREIGLAYQLADDLVDLVKGKKINSVIIPLLIILKNKNIAKNPSKIKQLYMEEIRRHVKKAEKLGKSEIIPQSPYKDLLKEAPSSIINKMLKEINIAI